MVKAKHAFWMALVFTVIVFVLGLLYGFFLENSRADSIQQDLVKSEINLLDMQVMNRQITDANISCELAQKSTFDFADRTYLEAQQLEKYAAKNQFIGTLKTIHMRYDLLRMIILDEAMNIKSRCNSDFHVIVYFFNYDAQDVDMRVEQSTFSAYLTELKNKYSSKILLIPIASNLDLNSVNLTMSEYAVNKTPAILVDNKNVIYDVGSLKEIEKMVK
jgi:hypothetical protein